MNVLLKIKSGCLLFIFLLAACADTPSEKVSLEPQLLESQKLIASDGRSSDTFGTSVAVDGNFMIVGSPFAQGPTNLSQGAAYLYHKNSLGNWQFLKKLYASDATEYDRFGWSVDISGNTIVVGAWSNTIDGRFWQGAAYVFERNQGGTNNWGEVKRLLDSAGTRHDYFGWAAAIHGDTIVVGASEDRGRRGSISIFSRHQGGNNAWDQVAKRWPSDGGIADLFGYSVAISDNTIAVGAFWDDIGLNTDQGSVYILERDQGGLNNWGISKKLTASDGAPFDDFGHAVDIRGDTVVIGANNDDIGTNNLQGSAYVFVRNQGNWDQVKKLVTSDGKATDSFGESVTLGEDTIVVSVPGFGARGAAYVFRRDTGGINNWGFSKRLIPSDGVAADEFGRSVAISRNTVVVGSHLDQINTGVFQGSAYIFNLF